MTKPGLPLAAAQKRLGRPGRPRKDRGTLVEDTGALLPAPSKSRAHTTHVPVVCPPRLLTVHGAAAYLGVTPWRIRGLIHTGIIAPVRIPLGDGREERKHLLDRLHLDALVERWKS